MANAYQGKDQAMSRTVLTVLEEDEINLAHENVDTTERAREGLR